MDKLAAKVHSAGIWGEFLHSEPVSPVTHLLACRREGDRAAPALEEFMPLVYDALRQLAAHSLRQERSEQTLESTALVPEPCLRRAGSNPPQREWVTPRIWAHRYVTGGTLV